MVSNPDLVYNMADTLLAASHTALTNYGLTAPTRSYVSFEAPAFDCEELVVGIGPFHVGDTPGPGPERVHKGRPIRRTANFGIWIVQACYPVGDMAPPEPTDISAATKTITRVGWALFEGLIALQVAGSLFSTCPYVEIGPGQPIGPSGKAVAWSIPVAAMI